MHRQVRTPDLAKEVCFVAACAAGAGGVASFGAAGGGAAPATTEAVADAGVGGGEGDAGALAGGGVLGARRYCALAGSQNQQEREQSDESEPSRMSLPNWTTRSRVHATPLVRITFWQRNVSE